MNPRIYAVAVYSIGLSLILSVLGIIGLAVTEHPIPDVLQNLAVGSLTGLAGLLVTPRSAA